MRLLTTPLAALAAAACVLLALPGAVAEAAFPGTNGLIAFERGADIYTVTTDSAHTVSPLVAGASDPAWSADGTKLAFTQGGSIRVLTIGGSTSAALDTGTAPAWSPDGTMLAYEKGSDIWVISSSGGTARNLSNSGVAAGRRRSLLVARRRFDRLHPHGGGQRGHLDHGRSDRPGDRRGREPAAGDDRAVE